MRAEGRKGLDVRLCVPRDEDGEKTRAKRRTEDAVHAVTSMKDRNATRARAGSSEENQKDLHGPGLDS